MLREIDQDIWVAEQPLQYFGLSVGTRMTVIRLENRELVVISPIQVDNTIIRQLQEIGTVKHIIAPNLHHYLFAENFKMLYPDAIFWAVSGLKSKKPNLPIDKIIKDDLEQLWNGIEYQFIEGFRTITFRGFDPLQECVFFHPSSRTLILTDLAFYFDETFPFLTRLTSQILGGYKQLSPSVLERIATTEIEKFKNSIKKILNWDFERVIIAHGSIINENGKEKLKEGYQNFLEI
ncbi:MAG: DUF4336 domain-containing protein [Cyanobacteria bacterium]|jgi:hypothetical protein|nr:DUF4336 domain-containing protein [Cyanobacteria bacterium GSL.Bin1]